MILPEYEWLILGWTLQFSDSPDRFLFSSWMYRICVPLKLQLTFYFFFVRNKKQLGSHVFDKPLTSSEDLKCWCSRENMLICVFMSSSLTKSGEVTEGWKVWDVSGRGAVRADDALQECCFLSHLVWKRKLSKKISWESLKNHLWTQSSSEINLETWGLILCERINLVCVLNHFSLKTTKFRPIGCSGDWLFSITWHASYL